MKSCFCSSETVVMSASMSKLSFAASHTLEVGSSRASVVLGKAGGDPSRRSNERDERLDNY